MLHCRPAFYIVEWTRLKRDIDRVWNTSRKVAMRGIAYAATLKDGEVQKLSELPVLEERWPNWFPQSHRRVIKRLERGLEAENHLNEGACFLILLQREDSPVPRYQLSARCKNGQLQFTPIP